MTIKQKITKLTEIYSFFDFNEDEVNYINDFFDKNKNILFLLINQLYLYQIK